jgi:DNA-binding NarL/FixJ family response regulator
LWIQSQTNRKARGHIPGPDRIQFISDCFRINSFVAHFEVVAVINDGQAAVDATARLKPDLVSLDILMPKMDGMRAAQELRRQDGAKVVFLSVQQDEEFLAAAFESGATAYVFKSRMHSDLVWAIDRALAGEVFVSPGAEG